MRHIQEGVTQFVCCPAVADNKLLTHNVPTEEGGQVQLKRFSVRYLIVEEAYVGEACAALFHVRRCLRVLPIKTIATFKLPSIMHAAAVDACFDVAIVDSD